MKKLSYLTAIILTFLTSRGETLSDSPATTLLNSFIAEFSKVEANWKKDIRLNERPGNLQPGRQLGVSDHLGYFSFVPKTWADLTPNEQSAVLTDQRLKAFLISSRKGSELVVKDGQAMTAIDGTSSNVLITTPPTNSKKSTSPMLVSLGADKISSTPLGQPIIIEIPSANAN